MIILNYSSLQLLNLPYVLIVALSCTKYITQTSHFICMKITWPFYMESAILW